MYIQQAHRTAFCNTLNVQCPFRSEIVGARRELGATSQQRMSRDRSCMPACRCELECAFNVLMYDNNEKQ